MSDEPVKYDDSYLLRQYAEGSKENKDFFNRVADTLTTQQKEHVALAEDYNELYEDCTKAEKELEGHRNKWGGPTISGHPMMIEQVRQNNELMKENKKFKEILQELYVILEFDPCNTEITDFPQKATKAMNVCSKHIRKFIDNE